MDLPPNADAYPEHGEFAFLDGRVWVDLSMEEAFIHNRLKSAFSTGEDAVIEVSEQAATVWLRASQVAWARLHTRESRIGF